VFRQVSGAKLAEQCVAFERYGRMRYALLVLLLGCERADSLVDAPTLALPEPPESEAMRSSSTVNEPPPPRAAPVAPDLVGLRRTEKQWFLSLSREQRHAVRQVCRAQRKNPCLGLLPKTRGASPDPNMALLASLEVDRHEAHDFCFQANGRRNGCNTPLVLAFDAQPIAFDRSPGRFAFEVGKPVASDWPTAATPWLALDRDGDGAITSGAELFGDATGDARNGFEALAILDDNRDGVIDGRDPIFGALLLWADADGDRKSSHAELRRLADVVDAIPLEHHIDTRCVRGNCEGERGSFTWRDGDHTRTGAVVDVYLRSGL
jgi:hypothetical protein